MMKDRCICAKHKYYRVDQSNLCCILLRMHTFYTQQYFFFVVSCDAAVNTQCHQHQCSTKKPDCCCAWEHGCSRIALTCAPCNRVAALDSNLGATAALLFAPAFQSNAVHNHHPLPLSVSLIGQEKDMPRYKKGWLVLGFTAAWCCITATLFATAVILALPIDRS